MKLALLVVAVTLACLLPASAQDGRVRCEMQLDNAGPHADGGVLVRAVYLNDQCGDEAPTFLEVNVTDGVRVERLKDEPFAARVSGKRGTWTITARASENGGRAFARVTLE
jgi:hypothetical protein